MGALWFFCLRNKQQQKDIQAVQNDEFFRYNPVPDRRPLTEGFAAQPMASQSSGGNLQHNPSILSNTNASSNQTARLAPLRRTPGPVILEPPYLHRQMSQTQSDINSTSSNPTTSGRGLNISEANNNVDIRALAQEVAAVLYQNPAKDYSAAQDPRRQMTVQNIADEAEYAPSTQTSHQPPPNYRAATGPSSVGSRSQGKAQYP
jgi:hypothetical protein